MNQFQNWFSYPSKRFPHGRWVRFCSSRILLVSDHPIMIVSFNKVNRGSVSVYSLISSSLVGETWTTSCPYLQFLHQVLDHTRERQPLECFFQVCIWFHSYISEFWITSAASEDGYDWYSFSRCCPKVCGLIRLSPGVHGHSNENVPDRKNAVSISLSILL